MEEEMKGAATGSMNGLEKMLDEWLVKKAPVQLPAKAKEVIVKVAPWATLVILILLAPALLAVFGLGALFGSVAGAYGVFLGPLYYVSLVVLLVQIVIMAISIPGLFKRKLSAWRLVFYSDLVAVAYSVVSWLGHPTAVFGLIWSLLWNVVAFYILFQVRSYYK